MAICDYCKDWFGKVIKSRLDTEEPPRRVRKGHRDTLIIHETRVDYDIEALEKFSSTCWFCCRIFRIYHCAAATEVTMLRLDNIDEIPIPPKSYPQRDSLPINVAFISSKKAHPLELLELYPYQGDYCNDALLYCHIRLYIGNEEHLRSTQKLSRAQKFYESYSLSLSNVDIKVEDEDGITLTESQDKATNIKGHLETVNSFLVERLPQVLKWLDICDRCHQCILKTGKMDIPRRLPKRLLHFSKKSNQVKVVHTSKLADEESLRYATLSHCWGTREFDKLCVANLDKAMLGFEIAELGPTFQQAIWLCQGLSIEYLWIDSRCIIQGSDNESEWEEEAQLVSQIYGNSYLNIAATSSKSCYDGLLRSQQLPLLSAIKIKLPDGRIAEQIPSQDNCELLEELFNQSALLKRGWVMQEIYVAPRTLHVTDVEMYWICQHRLWSESSGIESPIPIRWNQNVALNTEEVVGLDIDTKWERLAQNHSETRVTKELDRLHAISSLTALFHQEYKNMNIDTYFIVGCWWHDFVRFLSWRPVDGMKCRPEQHHVLPSWSWLSYPGRIEFPTRHENSVFETIAKAELVELRLVKPELTYGPVEYASACLCAPLFVISMVNRRSRGNLKSPHVPRILFLLTSSSHNIVLVMDDRSSLPCNVFEDLDYPEEDAWLKPLICALTFRQKGRSNGYINYHGLLLHKSDNIASKGRPMYKRAGAISFFCHETRSEYGRDVQSFFQLEKFPKCEMLIE